MTTREFYTTRLADLHAYFRVYLQKRWTYHIRKKLGPTCVNALMPSYRRRLKQISFKTIDKLEAYAAELGYRGLAQTGLPSEDSAQHPGEIRCPCCGARICLTLTHPFRRGVTAC